MNIVNQVNNSPFKLYQAVRNTGRLSLIKDNKVVGEAKVCIRRGDEWVGIEMVSAEAIDLVKEHSTYKLLGKHSFWRFSPITGHFLGCNFPNDENEDADGLSVLGDVRVVDADNLKYGLVPDTFKDVEGYRSYFDKRNKRK